MEFRSYNLFCIERVEVGVKLRERMCVCVGGGRGGVGGEGFHLLNISASGLTQG
jgi:hypothetical protein